jgi:hypothetical protein
MPTGLLEVSGTIDPTQFWPSSESDAGPVKVHRSSTDAFRFTAHPGGAPKITHAFEGAQVHGKVTKGAHRGTALRLPPHVVLLVNARAARILVSERLAELRAKPEMLVSSLELRSLWGEWRPHCDV